MYVRRLCKIHGIGLILLLQLIMYGAVKVCGKELFAWDARLFGEMPREIAKCKAELSGL